MMDQYGKDDLDDVLGNQAKQIAEFLQKIFEILAKRKVEKARLELAAAEAEVAFAKERYQEAVAAARMELSKIKDPRWATSAGAVEVAETWGLADKFKELEDFQAAKNRVNEIAKDRWGIDANEIEKTLTESPENATEKLEELERQQTEKAAVEEAERNVTENMSGSEKSAVMENGSFPAKTEPVQSQAPASPAPTPAKPAPVVVKAPISVGR